MNIFSFFFESVSRIRLEYRGLHALPIAVNPYRGVFGITEKGEVELSGGFRLKMQRAVAGFTVSLKP
jgi:hypothetical protein